MGPSRGSRSPASDARRKPAKPVGAEESEEERNLFGPPPEEMLEELKRLAEFLGVDVRYETTGGRVGRCLLHGQWIVMVDKSLPLREKVEGLALSLADLDYENVYLSPACRELLESHRNTPAQRPARPSAAPREHPLPVAPLSYEEVKRAVERLGDVPRVPLFWHKFYNAGTVEKYGEALQAVSSSVVDDCIDLNYTAPGNFAAPEGCAADYRWAIGDEALDFTRTGITSRLVVPSTELIDDFIATMPDPSPEVYFAGARERVAQTPGRYRVGWDFFCLFEAMWFRFGMADILADMLLASARIERLCWAFTEYHKRVATRYAEAGAHAYFTSDDLGTQTGLMFSRDLFRGLLRPCYEDLIRHCHRLGLSFWFHCCGAVTELLDDFVAMGVDVLHPIQPYAMDQRAVAREYAGQITFLAGIDVQYLLPQGSVADVERGTRELIDTFDRSAGGCLLAASNGIMPETPLANIAAWLQTAQSYGADKRASYARLE